MTDDRQQARDLYAEIRAAKASGVSVHLLREKHWMLAALYEARAMKDLDGDGIGSWPELFAAITEYANAGEIAHAGCLIVIGKRHDPPHAEAMHRELDDLASWIAGLPALATEAP